MEEISDRCCRPRRPTCRREGGRESPPTREGSGILGATDPDYAGGAKQPNTILAAQAISPPPPEEDGRRKSRDASAARGDAQLSRGGRARRQPRARG